MSSTPSITKQIMGAVGGAAIALVAYSAYEIVSPHLTALTSVPQSREVPGNGMYFRSAADELDQEYFDRVSQRTQQIVQQLGQKEGTRDVSDGFVVDPTQSPRQQYMEAVKQPTTPKQPAPIVRQPWVPAEEPAMDPVPEQPMQPADNMRANVVQQEMEVKHMNAEDLPSSGIGAWLLAILACAVAGVRHVRRSARA